ncbi:MAG: GTP-binding protein [Spirochaetales bacterium]|nr:GTP-binding protein [Spirochaetales bacterium]
MKREQLNIVIVGHVDHGKSTVIGRLLADTNSLPEGKLDTVKQWCKKNARPFEYAFLLDALKDEQTQGITIDTARCFFKTTNRDYIILDAPGHIEFLKNMITGASRAEAALLVIDAKEGIQENSKRHGHMVALLGIRQVSILVNKMDLVGYDYKAFQKIKDEYTDFLEAIHIKPVSFIPISAREGANIVSLSDIMPWYKGLSVLEQVDDFQKSELAIELPFRFPVQDIYKFTASGDNRRIIAGNITTGSLKQGDRVKFLPSGKESVINKIEGFNISEKEYAYAGEAIGVTLTTQVYIKLGELMIKADDKELLVSSYFKANIFWVGKAPMLKHKTYKLKINAAKVNVKLIDIKNVLDASDLSSNQNKKQIDRHDVAECFFETSKPIAFDLANQIETTGRFVIIDNYEIVGGGIILDSIALDESSLQKHIRKREFVWEKSSVTPSERTSVYRHNSKFIIFTGEEPDAKKQICKALERKLFDEGFKVYFLGVANIKHGIDEDISDQFEISDEYIRRLGELARIMTDSGQIFITNLSNPDDFDLEKLKLLNKPNEILVINVGNNNLHTYQVDLNFEENIETKKAVHQVFELLRQNEVILDYVI